MDCWTMDFWTLDLTPQVIDFQIFTNQVQRPLSNVQRPAILLIPQPILLGNSFIEKLIAPKKNSKHAVLG